jgi:hypothetical protein
MSSMYNVIQKLRAGEPLTDKEKTITNRDSSPS